MGVRTKKKRVSSPSSIGVHGSFVHAAHEASCKCLNGNLMGERYGKLWEGFQDPKNIILPINDRMSIVSIIGDLWEKMGENTSPLP